jgi:hypothetical protein
MTRSQAPAPDDHLEPEPQPEVKLASTRRGLYCLAVDGIWSLVFFHLTVQNQLSAVDCGPTALSQISLVVDSLRLNRIKSERNRMDQC